MSELRRRDFVAAKHWAEHAVSTETITPRQKAAAFFVQATALAHLGEIELAHSALGNGDELIKQPRDPYSPHVFGDTWCDWTIAELLRREAAEFLGIKEE